MRSVRACRLPPGTLLSRHTGSGAYVDCYKTELAAPVSQAQFVEAFYTGAVFKLERWLLAWFASRPSTDAEARELAAGERREFAAWTVVDRTDDQLLMCANGGHTRSWLMVQPLGDGDAPRTRLYFGSAVLPSVDRASGQRRMHWLFHALLGFHKFYSRVLLRAARVRLVRGIAQRRHADG
jgi:hypothetical protein